MVIKSISIEMQTLFSRVISDMKTLLCQLRMTDIRENVIGFLNGPEEAKTAS